MPSNAFRSSLFETFRYYLKEMTNIPIIDFDNYPIGQNFVGQNFRRSKYFVGQNFRHQAEISTVLSDFYLTIVLEYWTKFSTDKMFRRTKFSTPS